MKNNLKKYLLVALMAAVISIIAPISIVIPLSPVPISLGTFIILLNVFVLGGKYGTISTLIYILLGFIGLPVFTGWTGGVSKVLGPTGGYIIGYIWLPFVTGLFVDKYYSNVALCFVGMIIGTLLLYIFGTIWLANVTHMTFNEALLAGVVPFIVGDIVKMVLASILGRTIREKLIKANLL